MSENDLTISQMLNSAQPMDTKQPAGEDINDDNTENARHSGWGESDTDQSQWTVIKGKRSKRRRVSRGSVEFETFENMNCDEKLNVLFRKLSNIEESQEDLNQMKDTAYSQNGLT